MIFVFHRSTTLKMLTYEKAFVIPLPPLRVVYFV